MPIHQLTPQDAKLLCDNNEGIIIDLRGEDQFQKEHIVGAENMPSDTLHAGNLPDRNGKKLIVHCNKGGRAGRFCNALMAEDSEIDIYHLQGGIEAWKEAGFGIATK